VHLTELSIRALKTDAQQVDYWDTTTPGFGIRVGRRSKTFVAKRANRRHTIGRYPAMSLQDARIQAKRLLVERNAIPTPDVRFADALDTFIATHCAINNRPSTQHETERLLRANFLPRFKNRQLGEITPHDISNIIDRLLDRPSAANHAFTAIRTFFRWTVKRRYLPSTPCAGMGLPTKSKARHRVLSDQELRSVWRAADDAAYPFGAVVKLLILTGQRRGEIAALRWEWINRDKRTITFPALATKNGREHTIPYGEHVARVLDTLPNHSGLLFPARGKDTPLNGWSKCKEGLDEGSGVANWTLHDLRRTFATNLAALNVPPHVTERLLNHASGTISGVAAIYNRHAYMDEMREAIAKWEAFLALLLAAQKTAVEPLAA
jgi:integrase